MMRQYITAAMVYGFISVLPAAAIEIVDIRGLGNAEIPREYMMSIEPKMSLGFPEVTWIGRDKLLYRLSPLYWSGNIVSGNFSRISEIEKRAPTRFTDSTPVTQFDAAVIEHSKSMDEWVYGFYSVQTGWIDIDRSMYLRLSQFPSDEETKRLSRSADGLIFWKYRLLGGHVIVPRPAYDDINYGPDITYGLSIRHAETGELQMLPPGFLEFRGIGSATLVDVSFDRFRLALTAMYISPSEEIDEEYRESNIFVMRVVYDGTLRVPADIRSEPSWESPVTGRLNAGTVVKVQDADRYTLTDSGEEDFWYRVESDIHTGWVFGGSLIIEGEDWRERLEDRGRPLDVNTLTADN